MFFIIVQVSAKDANGNDIEPPSDIRIEVEDINDNSPVFPSKSQHANVKENSPPGKFVRMLRFQLEMKRIRYLMLSK